MNVKAFALLLLISFSAVINADTTVSVSGMSDLASMISGLMGSLATLLSGLSTADMQIITDYQKSLADIATETAKCTAVASPTSYASCSGAFTSTKAVCCYFTHETTHKMCGAIPTSNKQTVIDVYKHANMNVDCATTYAVFSMVVLAIFAFVF
jgi:hypothetical protein